MEMIIGSSGGSAIEKEDNEVHDLELKDTCSVCVTRNFDWEFRSLI